MKTAVTQFLNSHPDRVLDVTSRSENRVVFTLPNMKVVIDPKWKGTCSRERVLKQTKRL